MAENCESGREEQGRCIVQMTGWGENAMAGVGMGRELRRRGGICRFESCGAFGTGWPLSAVPTDPPPPEGGLEPQTRSHPEKKGQSPRHTTP